MLAANWKMNPPHLDGAKELCDAYMRLSSKTRAPLICFVPSCYLPCVQSYLSSSRIEWGGQHSHSAAQGAYTGDISASMLTSFGSQWVLAGHSDRRLRHGEHGTFISSQCRLAMDAGLRVILCVGEEKWLLHGYMSVMRQLSHSLSFLKDASDVGHALSMLAIAYEPVWAIGSGRAASVDYIEDIHGRIRDWLVRHYGVAGRSVSILYGGSVSPSNAGEILGLSLVDGALLGGSSLNPSALLQICQIYDKVHDAGA